MEDFAFPLFYGDLIPFHDIATAREIIEDAFLSPGISGEWVPVELEGSRLPALQLQFEQNGELVAVTVMVGADGLLYSDVAFGDEEEGAPKELGVALATLQQVA